MYLLFFPKRNSKILCRNSESAEIFQFGGQTEMRSETKFATMPPQSTVPITLS